MNDLTVQDAATQLGITPTRVRALIGAGNLPARKLGGIWILDAFDVEAMGTKERAGGRPLAPRMAWGLIALAEGRDPAGLSAPERSRLRKRLRDPQIGNLARLTRKRATIHQLHVHRGALSRARGWPGGILTGISATGHGLVKADAVEIYLTAEALGQLTRDLHARPASSTDANLTVHVPTIEPWPFVDDAGPVTIAFDLWDAGDDRSRRVARDLFERAVAAYAAGAAR